MVNSITRTASTALNFAGGAATHIKDGVARWVPGAIKAIGAGAQLAVLRDGGRKVAKVVKRNPVATATVVAAAAGAGLALWLMRRNRTRRALDEEMRSIEVKPERVKRTRPPARVRKAPPVRTSSRAAARVNGAD